MKYIIKKTITLILTLLTVTFLTFIAFEIIPGDSALTSLGTDATPEQVEALREQLGYNEPVLVRYKNWLFDALTGDFGTSTNYKLPVSQLIKERLPITVSLAVISILMTMLISVPLGIVTTKNRHSKFEGVHQFFIHLGMAIPPFFLGIMITLVFGLLLKFFTPGTVISFTENKPQFFYYLLYPAIAVAVPKIAMMTKFLRSSIKRQLELDYVRTAYSKGSTKNHVLYAHVLKNALIPVITFFAMMVAEVFAGSIVVEQVFNLPGLGRLLVSGIGNRDYPVVQAIVLYIAALVILMNFIVDVLYQFIDPRVRAE
ncbi:MAG: ABC transporter permease [bacterium]|nr:ABC transporter permease [bacterium]